MEKVTYFSEIEGISLERMVRQGKFDMRINHFHNEYEIFFLLEGERHFFFNNRAYHVKGGDLILVDTNAIHMTRSASDTETGHDRIILYVERSKMQEFDNKFPHLNLIRFFQSHYGVYSLTPAQQNAFMTMYQRLQNEFDNRGRKYTIMIELEIIQYFIAFMRDSHTEAPAQDPGGLQKDSKYRTVYNIADYISEHYFETLTLDLLADTFYISKFYLSRIFKEVTGYGVSEYVNILRTRKAKQLLEETSLTISEIASEVGYQSITYFEKVFKVYMTLSPLKYRKTLNIVTYTNAVNPSAPEP